MELTLNAVVEVAEKYGFNAKIISGYEHCIESLNTKNNPSVQIYAKNTDGRWVKWFLFDSVREVFYGDETDRLNIWLCDTRKDLTADMLLHFFREIYIALNITGNDILMRYVDPEDWEEIADVPNAYNDPRYTKMEV